MSLEKLRRVEELEIEYNDFRRIDSDAALAHPEFGTSVNPITTRGADYAHLITASPPGFENPATSLNYVLSNSK